jgi:ssDNA-binding replication factor A large subunit
VEVVERVLNISEAVLKSGGCGAERRARGVQDSVIRIKVNPGAACSLGHIINIDGK